MIARDRANPSDQKPTYKSHYATYGTESGGKAKEEIHYSAYETGSRAKVKDQFRHSTYELESEADVSFFDMVMGNVVCRVSNLAT